MRSIKSTSIHGSSSKSMQLLDSQLGIWLGQQKIGNSPIYNASEYYEISGRLNVELFQKSCEFIINQCDCLFVNFKQQDSHIEQVINKHEFKLPIIDLSDKQNGEQLATKWMKTDHNKYIDIHSDSLFSIALIKLSENRFYWYQKIHHIVSDGYSFSLISQKVSKHYQLMFNDTDYSNQELVFGNYLDLIAEQDKYKQSKAFLKDQNFWKQTLDGIKEIQSFSDIQNNDFSEKSLELTHVFSENIFEGIKQSAQSKNCMWSDYLLATVAMLTAKFNSQAGCVLGLPVMGRMGSKSINIPAMVMNIVPIDLTFSTQASFDDILTITENKIKKSRPYFRYRYENMKQDNPDQKTLFGPVVNIMPFSHDLEFQDCHVKYHSINAGPVEDISFGFTVNENKQLKLKLEANPNRYNQERLTKIYTDFYQLLEKVLENPEHTMAIKMDSLSFYENPIKHIEPINQKSVWHKLFEQSQKHPNNIALEFENTRYSFLNCIGAVEKVAQEIESLSAKDSNKSIAILSSRSDLSVFIMFACCKLAKPFVFIDPQAPKTRKQEILKQADPELLIINDEQLSDDILNEVRALNEDVLHSQNIQTLNFKKLRIAVDQDNDVLISKPKYEQSLDQLPAYYIFTSGSTGTPKAVVIDQLALSEFEYSAKIEYQISKTDCVLQFAPLHFDTCIEEIFSSLCNGAKLYIRSESMIDSFDHFLTVCKKQNISVLDLPTAYWHELVYAINHEQLDIPKCIRSIIIGGEAAQKDRVASWHKLNTSHINLYNSYGPSEATVVATVSNLNKRQISKIDTNISIGKPLLARSVMVVDSALNLVKKNKAGELLLLGSGLAQGYLNNFEQTKNAFIEVTHPTSNKKVKAYRTNDTVIMQHDGSLIFKGRSDDQIKISGVRIEPKEIELALVNLQGIKQAVVLRSNQSSVTSLIAHLVLDDDINEALKNKINDITYLRSELKHSLVQAMLPTSVMLHKQFNLTASGKIDKKALNSIKQENIDHTIDSEKGFTQTSKKIKAVWQDVLGHNNIQINDDFFLLGGHSLQSIQISNRLSKLFGCEVSINTIFQYPVLKDLSQYIDAQISGEKHENLQSDQSLIEQDIVLFDKQFSLKTHPLNNNCSNRILLTGVTGFVGAQLLKQIDKQKIKSRCLVRADSIENARVRIEQALTRQSLKIDHWENIDIQVVQLEQENFGLTENEFLKLALDCSAILHNAANTSVMRDYKSLRDSNAFSTLQLLKLAGLSNIEFNLVSTISVLAGAKQTQIDSEGFVEFHQGLQDGYQKSKWLAEQYTNLAKQKGLKTNIYRLGRVTGDSKTGFVNKKDIVWSILRVGIKHNILPDLNFSEPWSAVDEVSEFIIKDISEQTESSVFNLLAPKDVSLKQLYKDIRNHKCFIDMSLKEVSVPTWCEVVEKQADDEDLSILTFFEQRKSIPKLSEQFFRLNQTELDTRLMKYKLSIHSIDTLKFNQYLNFAIDNQLFEFNQININKEEVIV